MEQTSITVRHNAEMAHRLFLTPGKCEQIHGHSYDISVTLDGDVDERGMLLGIDFAGFKKLLRTYLDTTFDHRLLLNCEDTLAKLKLPGAALIVGDPTTENFAAIIGSYVHGSFADTPGLTAVKAAVWETRTNRAEWRWSQ